MKTLSTALLATLFLAVSCSKQEAKIEQPEEEQAVETAAITHRSCASQEVLEEQLRADPRLRQRMSEIEAFTQRAIENPKAFKLDGDTIEIPVVVHVLWNTPAQDISDAQVQSQISVLNEDFQNKNTDGTLLPANSFQAVRSQGLPVRFVLAQAIHKYTKTSSFSSNDAVKNSKRGGDNAIDAAENLNIWVCNLGQGLLGYAQFPGGSLSTDGVVILYKAFGSRAKVPGGTFTTSYDLGRTATHEVGHWMNLRHIWGDDNGACSGSDLVTDTPNQGAENYGTPTYPHTSCSNGSKGDMFMNYMDYTDDKAMYMFSANQKDRMMAIFTASGPRSKMGD
ncbi:zinc metalloprotease [Segetibacter aerophilus]|uniref:Zinc metalloprotease n=1 Tax=Segetibacter aerophilus TaxID=670293 RepID=A0A512BK62_9BACT|nr:zinc metalloprotease [Segetibacter aerophilus]GEO12207.1 zinc metalloprotease [Segetibacter aerophilus]